MIIKESKSGNAWVVIDDHGEVYIAPKTALHALEAKTHKSKSGFFLLSRMPQPAQPGRFKKSPLLGKEYKKIWEGDEGWVPPQCSHNLQEDANAEDGLSPRSARKRERKEAVQDKAVDWG